MNDNEATSKKVTPEMLEKIMKCKTAEDLIALAKENNVELSVEQAKELLEKLRSEVNELSDDELLEVTGGSYLGSYLYEKLTAIELCFGEKLKEVILTIGDYELSRKSRQE